MIVTIRGKLIQKMPSEIIIDAIIKMGKDAGDLHALCNRHKIPHYFTTWR